jgi:hypothetical protein
LLHRQHAIFDIFASLASFPAIFRHGIHTLLGDLPANFQSPKATIH